MTTAPLSPPALAPRPLETHPPRLELRQLLTLEGAAGGDDCRAGLVNDVNSNGRVFGGQLLGQAVAAALRTMGAERRIAMLQLVFLRGARVDERLDFRVERLQDGRRYASRRVAGFQGGERVFSAHVTATSAPPAEAAPSARVDPRPRAEDLPSPRKLPLWLVDRVAATSFQLGGRGSIDFRLVDPERELVPPQPGPSRLRYWIRARQPLGDDPGLHASTLAYLSDYWLTFAALAHRVTALPQRKAYVASVNHTIVYLAPCRADEWLYVDADGVDLGDGRALSQARVWTHGGREVARMTQECAVTDRV
jgi:acyl-CoA thioesterase-2